MDVLSDVLRAVRLTGAIFFDVEARVPWVAHTPPVKDFAHAVMPGSGHGAYLGAAEAGRPSTPLVNLGVTTIEAFLAGDLDATRE